MSERIAALLLRLSPRERFLLGLLALVILPAAVAWFLLLPLAASREEARAGLAEAVALERWVAARAAEHRRAVAALGTAGGAPAEAMGLSALEQSLVEIGLREDVTRLARREGGAVELGFDEVDFQSLTLWLDRTAPGWGYRILSFGFVRGQTEGLVAAEFLLAPP